MRRILFPFFGAHHKFLLGKWWFRLLMLLYLFAIIASPFVIGSMYVEAETGWCWEYLQYLTTTGAEHSIWQEHLDSCMAIHKEIQTYVWGSMLLGPLVLHYLSMFVFFKVVIDFIALGRFAVKEN